MRRQSTDPVDLFHGHIGGIDVLAKSLLAAASLLESGDLQALVDERYARWEGDLGRSILDGTQSLIDLDDLVMSKDIEGSPGSGRQELLEQVVNRHIDQVR